MIQDRTTYAPEIAAEIKARGIKPEEVERITIQPHRDFSFRARKITAKSDVHVLLRDGREFEWTHAWRH